MSDFLARLGARHVAEPAVRPRVASRFEQTSALPLERENLAADVTPVEHIHRGALIDAVAALDARAATHPRLTPPPAPAEATSTFAADPQRREPTRSEQASAPRPPLAADGMDTRVGPVVESPRPVDDKQQRDVAEVVPRTPSPTAREALMIATRVATRTSMPSSSTRGADVVDSAAAAPDVIRVHIGRVEVRAVMPPAERSRPRGSKASDAQEPLSLDRYLSGKGRP